MLELFGDFLPCLKSLNSKCWLLAFIYVAAIVSAFVIVAGNNRSTRTARSSPPVVRRTVRTENRRPEHVGTQEVSAPMSTGNDA